MRKMKSGKIMIGKIREYLMDDDISKKKDYPGKD